LIRGQIYNVECKRLVVRRRCSLYERRTGNIQIQRVSGKADLLRARTRRVAEQWHSIRSGAGLPAFEELIHLVRNRLRKLVQTPLLISIAGQSGKRSVPELKQSAELALPDKRGGVLPVGGRELRMSRCAGIRGSGRS
jgi:hypothetical protein